jgi:serine phosphatase RsbU (regulator of sigma subunit)
MAFQSRLEHFASRLRHTLVDLEDDQRQRLRGEMIGIIYGALLSAAGLAWLVSATDLALLRSAWPVLLLMLLLATLLSWCDFYWIVARPGGSYDRWSAPLSGLVTMSAPLIYGPTAIWIGALVAVFAAARFWHEATVAAQRWFVIRTLLLSVSCFVIGALLGLALYQRLGGSFPLPGLAWPTVPLAALAVATVMVTDWLGWSCYLLIARWTRLGLAGARELALFGLFEVVAYVPELFGILSAAIYVQMGLPAFIMLILGALLVSVLVQQLSEAIELGGQRSRELAQLDRIGRALIAAAPDMSALGGILAELAPEMFRYEQITIQLADGATLLEKSTMPVPPAPQAAWAWLERGAQPVHVRLGEQAPWADSVAQRPLAAMPIVSAEGARVLGGILVRFSQTVDDPGASLPALQSLAALIASALYRAEEYERALAHQRVLQELSVAAEIQRSFLPDALPLISGWQLAATLRPARQTSGDFYDVLELPGGRLGLVIADVTDKGTGAALFMALSRTLIRSYAFEYPDRPELALQAANTRILSDSRSSMFVTVFYAVLDPAAGMLRYANAGHNPPFLLPASGQPAMLGNTGIPLGIEDGATWGAAQIDIQPGGVLVLYTDGVNEAQNAEGELFELERLLQTAQHSPERTAAAVQASILAAVDAFVGAAPQADDVTMLVLACTG